MAFKATFEVLVTKIENDEFLVRPTRNTSWSHTIKKGDEDYDHVMKAFKGKEVHKRFNAEMKTTPEGTFVSIFWDEVL